MLIALYHSDHKKDGLKARLGYALIRLGQISEVYSQYTHCEAILSGTWQQAEIGSASVRDGNKVRVKSTDLTPGHWTVLDVPAADVNRAQQWFEDNEGTPYSMAGAVTSALWIARVVLRILGREPQELGMWCSRAVGASIGLVGSQDMSVAELAAALWNLPGTRDVTTEFFSRPLEGHAT